MEKRVRILTLFGSVALMPLFLSPVPAQQPATRVLARSVPEPMPAASSGPSKEEMERRIGQLEAQMEQMRNELDRLKQAAANNKSVPAPVDVKETVAVATSQTKTEKPVPSRPGLDVGPVNLIPYGSVYFNLFGNSSGTNNADVPLFATPTGGGGVSATARETRLGLRFEGPQMWGAKSSGVFETDFSGGFPSIGIGEDFGVLRIRLAFMKLDWKNTTLEAGQDWTVFAPNNPFSLASVGAPEFAASGNLFARIPQIRLQRRWFDGKLSWDGAILGPRTGDYPAVGTTPAVLQPGSGAASRMPAFESRVALNSKDWFGSKKAGSIGISAHYGRARVATTPRNINLDVVGIAGDWNMSFGKRVTLNGEAFVGRNLAGFQGDIFQTFVPDFAYRVGTVLVPGGPRAPFTRGGWAQLGVTPAVLHDRLTLYGGFGVDDPRDQDFVSISRRDSKVRNRAFEINLLYKVTPQLSWGLEYRRLETLYIVSRRQNNNHLNLAAAYSF